jgi:hypothetical protein
LWGNESRRKFAKSMPPELGYGAQAAAQLHAAPRRRCE